MRNKEKDSRVSDAKLNDMIDLLTFSSLNIWLIILKIYKSRSIFNSTS